MVKVFVVLGVALLAGGGYAVVDGWPYLVLERGFTQVIIGALAVTAGLILLALAAVLVELRRLKGMVTGALAMMTLAGSERREEPVPASVLAGDEAPRAAERGGSVPATGLAAGAAAVGAAMAGLARPGDRPDEAGEDAVMARPEPEGAPATPPAAADEAAPTPAFDHDDWLSPPDPAPAHAVAAQAEADDAKPEAAIAAEPDFFEAELLPTPEEPAAAPAIEAETADTGPAEAEPAAAAADAAPPDLALEPEPAAATADEDRIWWPRLDRFDEGKAGPGNVPASSDDFGALREHLAGATSAKTAPEIEPPRRDLDIAGSWTAPRPWPPVTQPRPPEALGELEAPAPAEEAEAEGEREKSEEDWRAPPVAPEPSPAPAAEAEPAPAEDEPALAAPEAEAEPPAPEEGPASSEEGVIGAYQVGETHFTMYADGSIHARTPDGDYVFASMDELKAYLASEKNRLEPSSN